MTVFEILINYHKAFLSGLRVTLELCLIVWSLGLFLGAILGVAGGKWKITIGIPSRLSSFLLSGTPILVFLFWLHYPLQSILNVVIDPFYTATATLTILNTLAVADIVRNVLSDFPNQFIVAAKVCGIPPSQTFRHIQFPIVFRQILPGLLTQQVYMLQATLFASLISVNEIFRAAQRINSEIYKPVEIYTSLAVFFLIICLPLNGLALWLKKKYTRDVSEG
jgi:polar amino acid transport system permease protein